MVHTDGGREGTEPRPSALGAIVSIPVHCSISWASPSQPPVTPRASPASPGVALGDLPPPPHKGTVLTALPCIAFQKKHAHHSREAQGTLPGRRLA